MTTEFQSNILSANSVKKAMPSCFLFALVQSMLFMVDNIVAGHFMGSEAVAAVALGIPLIGLMISFTVLILEGSFLKMLEAMGHSNMKDYHRFLCNMLTLTIIVDVIFLLICLLCTNPILHLAGAYKATPEAVIMGRLYLRTACWMILLFSLGCAFQIVMTTYGYQTDRMITSIICVVVNVVSSVIFVNTLTGDMRIAGLGIGSALGTLAQTISGYYLMKRRNISIKYRFYPFNKVNIMDCLDMLKRGIPSSVDNMMDAVCGSVINNIILSIFVNGTSILAMVAVIKTLANFIRTTGKAVFYASEPMFGILNGGRDNEGIKTVFHTSLKLGLTVSGALALIIIALHIPILMFYNMSDIHNSRIGLILAAISGMLFVFSYLLTAVYEATDNIINSLLLAVIPDSLIYPMLIPVLTSIMGITGIWIAMGFGFIPFFIIYYLILALINRSFPLPLERLLLLHKSDDRSLTLDVSIPTDSENVSFVSETLQNFFKDSGTPSRVAYASALCMEEIAADYLEHRKTTGSRVEDSFMDIKAFHDPKK